MVAGVTIVNIPKLEKRFDFSPADTSFILAGNNIAFCAFILFVAYFGERYNKARFTAIGGAIFGLGALMYALPHFTTEIYELPDNRFKRKVVIILFLLVFFNSVHLRSSENKFQPQLIASLLADT